jgi:hypothetical protein
LCLLCFAATERDNTGHLILDGSAAIASPFEYGAGQINPKAAADPGLVYEASIEDYILFLCGLGYNTSSMHVFTNSTFVCPNMLPLSVDLNYPSIALSALQGERTVTRTVTNVGSANSLYSVVIHAPANVQVSISPEELLFHHKGEKLVFQVTFTTLKVTGNYSFGSYTWTDGQHHVRSPFAVQAV